MSDRPPLSHPYQEPSPSLAVREPDEQFLATHPWVRHYAPGVPFRITIPDHPLPWLLEQTVSRYSDHPALIYYGNRLTYAQFSHAVDSFALALQHLGVKKGDRIAIALPNIPQFPIAFYGALRIGAVVVPTNPLYTERELQYQLADSGANVLVMLDELYPGVRAIRTQTALKHIILTNPADFLPLFLRALYPFNRGRSKQPEQPLTHKELHTDLTLHNMSTMLQEFAAHTRACDVLITSSDLATLQYTGGTTGISKGAMLTHAHLLADVIQTRAWFPEIQEGKEVMLCVAPFFHAYGMTAAMNLSILIAATMTLVPHFKAEEVLNVIRHDHPTLFPGIPTMYLAIMRVSGKHVDDLRSIKYCISGSASLPAKVQADFEAITGGRLVEGYGLSEAGPATHCNPLTEECRNGSLGLPLPNVEATIVDQETGKPVPIGELGEIVVRGPNVMQGYWHREQETRTTLRQGWLHTGDLGRMDEDGYFYLTERAKDVIIASGFKIYPREVEEVLFQHPSVADVAVVGVPDEYRGETVAAFVVLKPGIESSESTRRELIHFCEQVLTPYKVPKIVQFQQNLPKSLIGKVVRRQLRTQYIDAHSA